MTRSPHQDQCWVENCDTSQPSGRGTPQTVSEAASYYHLVGQYVPPRPGKQCKYPDCRYCGNSKPARGKAKRSNV